MAPLVFKDIQKSGKDLLKDDYCFDKKFKLSTKTMNGIALTHEGTMSAKGTEGKITAKFKVDTVSIDKLFTTTNGRIGCEASIKDVVDGLKVGLKFEDGVAGSGLGSGSINATYSKDMLTLTEEIDIVNGPTITTGLTLEYDAFVAGAEVKYNTQFDEKEPTPTLEEAGAVLGYTAPDFAASVHALEKGKKLNFVLHHKVDANTAIAAQLETELKSNGAKTMTIGGTRRIDADTAFSAKVDSKGIVSANWIQVIRPEVKVIASASVDAKNFAGDAHKFGLQLILGA